MHVTSQLLKKLSCTVLAVAFAAASSAIAAPATLSTTITGIGVGGPADHPFGTLPQNVNYTFTSSITYDGVGNESGSDNTYGRMAITLVAGDQRLEFINPAGYGTSLWVSQYAGEHADGYNNELHLYSNFDVDVNGRTFEIWQTIRWKDGTAAPTDVLRTPQLLSSDDYKWDLSIKAWWDVYWLATMQIENGAGTLAVSLVPEPSEAGMLLAGLALGAVAIRRRAAERRGA